MTTYRRPDYVDQRMAFKYTGIKMEGDTGDDRSPLRSPPMPGIPITTVVTANENWRGKNDPAERRRIQNRLNQRAFRQRQRAGESPKQYKPRANSAPHEDDDDDDESDEDDNESESTTSPTGNMFEGRMWDELAQLINRNFLSAAVTNAQHLGIDVTNLQTGTVIRTPRSNQRPIPPALTPVEAQYHVPHDPIIDTLPHARLRYNILRAIAAGHLDSETFCKSLRASGAMEETPGGWQRGGVVVWSFPEQVGSWELSEPFVRRWHFLLQGCEDLIAVTNSWRGKRSERLFPASFDRAQSSGSS